MNSLEKTLACVKALELASKNGSSHSETKGFIKKNLGPSWSIVSAAQFLTGRSAIASLQSLPNDYEHDGLNKLVIAAFIADAHEFCANAFNSSSISNGVLISNFKTNSSLNEIERLQSILIAKKEMH